MKKIALNAGPPGKRGKRGRKGEPGDPGTQVRKNLSKFLYASVFKKYSLVFCYKNKLVSTHYVFFLL